MKRLYDDPTIALLTPSLIGIIGAQVAREWLGFWVAYPLGVVLAAALALGWYLLRSRAKVGSEMDCPACGGDGSVRAADREIICQVCRGAGELDEPAPTQEGER